VKAVEGWTEGVDPASAERSGVPLLEREAELSILRSLLASVRTGAGAVAVIEGPPGIGKTGLLNALSALARGAAFLVLTAIGIELELDYAFGVVRQLFEPVIAGLDQGERAAVLAGAAAAAGPLVDPRHNEPAPARVPGDMFPVLHGLYWMCANLSARRPLAILVDDAHWADGQSLRWLHYVSSRLEGQSVCIVAAARSTRPEAPVPIIEATRNADRSAEPSERARLAPAPRGDLRRGAPGPVRRHRS
jgi:hypothetical protein